MSWYTNKLLKFGQQSEAYKVDAKILSRTPIGWIKINKRVTKQ